MRLDAKGKKFIHSFEGCRLKAYKAVPTEKYWTIGWGHYGPDVKQGQVITQKQADEMFDKDIAGYENAVNKLGMSLNQNEFNALVSFAYNCGVGNLNRLCSDRSKASIRKWITAYNKSGGNVLAGLTRRRNEELKMFNTPVSSNSGDAKKPASKSSVAGKRVESKVEGLRFYKKASWEDKDVAGIVKKGHGFTIVSKVKVGGAEQYKVKNSKGAVYYITASSKYVLVK